MLTELMRQAKARDWQVFLESAAEGFCARLTAQVLGERPRIASVDISPSLSVGGALSASVGSASAEVASRRPQTLREALSSLSASRRVKPGAGVLICIDETQSASQQDLRELAVTYQQLVQEQDLTGFPDHRQKGVAVVMAGLPQTVDTLVTADLTSFLARAQHHVLGEIPVDEVALSYREVVETCGMAMSKDEDAGSSLTDLESRCDKSRCWIQKRRRSLADAQIIMAAERGRVSFPPPYMADWIASMPEQRLLGM